MYLLAPEKFRTFSQFFHFYINNDNNFPYISIKLFWRFSKFQTICQNKLDNGLWPGGNKNTVIISTAYYLGFEVIWTKSISINLGEGSQIWSWCKVQILCPPSFSMQYFIAPPPLGEWIHAYTYIQCHSAYNIPIERCGHHIRGG